MTQPNVRADVATFLQFLAAQQGPKMNEIPIADARAMMGAMRHIGDADVGELARIENFAIPGPAGDIPARLYDAKASRAPGLVMVFYHGGGFTIGDLDTHEPYCAEAARVLDMPVIAIDYRLAPEHPFPAAPIDSEAATRWIADNIPCTGLILSGDSAGGNLTVVTAMALRDAPASRPVVAQYPIYPAVSGSTGANLPSFAAFKDGFFLTEEMMAWFGESYGGDDGRQIAPLLFDLKGMPPAVVITAGLDPLRDQGRAYAAKLIEQGIACTYIEAAGNIHGFINMRKAIPSTAKDMADGFAALKTLLAAIA